MREEFLIAQSNNEKLGSFYIEKAYQLTNSKKIEEALIFYKKGIELVTGEHIKHTDIEYYQYDVMVVRFEEYLQLFYAGRKSELSVTELFVKACYSLYTHENIQEDSLFTEYRKNNIILSIGLFAIEKYLSTGSCAYGYYIKGRLLLEEEKPKEALIAFKTAESFGNLNCVTYQIGKLTAGSQEDFGLAKLVRALLNNPSSFPTYSEMSHYWNEAILEGVLENPRSESSLNSFDLPDVGLLFTDDKYRYAYYEILKSESNLSLHALLNSNNQNTVRLFKFLQDSLKYFEKEESQLLASTMSEDARKLIKEKEAIRKKRKEERENRKHRKSRDSIDYEEIIMRALSNGNGDKFGY